MTALRVCTGRTNGQSSRGAAHLRPGMRPALCAVPPQLTSPSYAQKYLYLLPLVVKCKMPNQGGIGLYEEAPR